MSRIETLFVGGVETVGHPHAVNKLDQQWMTAAYKKAMPIPVFLTKSGLEGDDVGDKKHHGGPEKALFAYSVIHYDKWAEEYPDAEFKAGTNGENVSVTDMDETTVCIGDIYRVGEALVQVSQPRRPCWKPGRRVKWIDFGQRIQDTGRTGWYFRVPEEGRIQQGDVFELVERPCETWTIAKMNDVLYHHTDHPQLMRQLMDNDYTPPSWKEELSQLLEGEAVDHTPRLYGPNI